MDGDIENKGRFSSIVPYLTPLHKKTIVSALGVLVLTLGTATGVILVQNQQTFKSLATCYDCPGGTCPDGWSYGPDSCSLQACDARQTEACASHQGGGGGGGNTGPWTCDGVTADQATRDMFTSVWCEPEQRWLWERGEYTGGDCGGHTSTLTTDGCDGGEAPPPPPPPPTCDDMCTPWKIGPCGGESDYVRCQPTHRLWTRSCPGDKSNTCSEAKCLLPDTAKTACNSSGGGSENQCNKSNCSNLGNIGSCISYNYCTSSCPDTYPLGCYDGTKTGDYKMSCCNSNDGGGGGQCAFEVCDAEVLNSQCWDVNSNATCDYNCTDRPIKCINPAAQNADNYLFTCCKPPAAPPPSGNACEDAGYECRYCPPFVGSWAVGENYQKACTGAFDACCDTGSGEVGQGRSTTINGTQITLLATLIMENMNKPVTTDNKEADLNNDGVINGVDWAILSDQARAL